MGIDIVAVVDCRDVSGGDVVADAAGWAGEESAALLAAVFGVPPDAYVLPVPARFFEVWLPGVPNITCTSSWACGGIG